MFCAAALREVKNLRISILEASGAPLKKVLLSGGGRCNFTNAAIDGGDPKDFYPRGARHLRKPLRAFGCGAAREFFRSIGAESKIEADGRVFPASDELADGGRRARKVRRKMRNALRIPRGFPAPLRGRLGNRRRKKRKARNAARGSRPGRDGRAVDKGAREIGGSARRKIFLSRANAVSARPRPRERRRMGKALRRLRRRRAGGGLCKRAGIFRARGAARDALGHRGAGCAETLGVRRARLRGVRIRLRAARKLDSPSPRRRFQKGNPLGAPAHSPRDPCAIRRSSGCRARCGNIFAGARAFPKGSGPASQKRTGPPSKPPSPPTKCAPSGNRRTRGSLRPAGAWNAAAQTSKPAR